MLPILKKMISTSGDGSRASDVGVLLLRVFIGLSMAFAHGMAKFPMSEQMISGVASLGFPMPEVFAHLAALAELVGGLLLAAGLLARPAAAFMAITMGVAAFAVHAADPFQVKELAFLYLFVSLFFVLHGAGRISLDFILQKKCK
ncbi:putative oxidoreductase CatD [compost metagenome]